LIGQTFSHFEITGKLGEGGMGEVYRARDTKLGREVAIKVLPEAVAGDPERLARFEREAKVLAALNHPNIAAIYSLESSGEPADPLAAGPPQPAVHFLAMELAEGEDLEERIDRGPVAIDEAVPLALQMAEALEAAHERGIIHRDLKPGNVRITAQGRAKVLDFGLAKALTPPDLEVLRSDAPSASPTLTAQMTRTGVVLGTAAYMAPEQIRGESVDKRADIWAFGATVFEMLTGERAFPGTTAAASMARVLEASPDWSLLPAATPTALRRLLVRCLDKDPLQRLRDIGEARVALQTALSPAAETEVETPGQWPIESRRHPLPWILTAALALALLGTLGWLVWRPRGRPAEPVRLSVRLPGEAPFRPLQRSSLAIAPDGSMFVYVGGQGEQQQLYLRRLREGAAVPLDNTEGAQSPFFSPDGQQIGFYVGNEMRRIPATGGPARTIGFAPPVTRGQVWLPERTILFTPNKASGLWRVGVADGASEEVVGVDADRQSSGYCWPDLLPSGRQALVSTLKSHATTWREAQILLLDLQSGETRELIEGGSQGRFVASGHIVFVQGDALMAVPFDPSTGSLAGAPIKVADDVLSDPASGVGHFAISDSGTLIYARGGSRSAAIRKLTWVERDGRTQVITPEPRAFETPRISPDGRRIAMTIAAASDDIWTLDLERGVFQRITFGGRNFMPIWAPDGKALTYASVAGRGFPALHTSPIDGSGPAVPLLEPGPASFPGSWTPDGQQLVFGRLAGDTGGGIYLLGPDRSVTPLLDSPFNESSPVISPDGQWLAFVSDESGWWEVNVASFPDLQERLQVSSGGGTQPVWGRDSRQLFFQSGGRIQVVELRDRAALRFSPPRTVVDKAPPDQGPVPGYPSYDLAPDGSRFLMPEGDRLPLVDQFEVVLNWFNELG
jgi:serine/threonine protein kinase/Tol biopolymer transport system component